MQKGVFNKVAQFVEMHVIGTLSFPILFGWDNWSNSGAKSLINNRVGIITPISD
jgi:hypothetical protein